MRVLFQIEVDGRITGDNSLALAAGISHVHLQRTGKGFLWLGRDIALGLNIGRSVRPATGFSGGRRSDARPIFVDRIGRRPVGHFFKIKSISPELPVPRDNQNKGGKQQSQGEKQLETALRAGDRLDGIKVDLGFVVLAEHGGGHYLLPPILGAAA
ncbi:MAG TPA: hypothetical protein VK579_17475 [Terriglobales bacterium]|nr:hypothetical protein [Terriglobales bacterium]